MPTSPDTARRPALKVLTLTLATIVGLFVIAGAIVALNASTIANHVKDRVVPRLSERLGREVSVERVEVRILPRPRAELLGFRIAGAPGEPELIRAGRTTTTVELWPLLRSLGKDVRISAVELDDARLHLVRRRDGSWSHRDLMRPGEGGSEREVIIDRLTVRRGTVAISDAERGREATVALERIDATARDIGPGLPLSLELTGSFASDARNLEVRLSLDRLPAGPDPLAPPRPPKVTGRLSLESAELQRLGGLLPARLDALVQGGQLSVRSTLTTGPGGDYTATGTATLEALRLRGAPSRGGFAFTATVPPAKPEAVTVELSQLSLTGPGLDLGGSARLSAAPLRIRFDLRGAQLDLDHLLALRSGEPSPPGPERGQLVPPGLRERLADLSVAGTLALDEVRSGALTATDLRADLTLTRGLLHIREGGATLYGGGIRLDGTRVDLLADRPRWELKAVLKELDVGLALARLTRERPVTGRVDAELSLRGDGNDWGELREHLTGRGELTLRDGSLATDLGERIAVPLRAALARMGLEPLARRVAAARSTRLDALAMGFTVEDGWMRLSRPLALATPIGTASLSGRIALDRRLDLSGDLALAPSFVADVSGGRFRPRDPIAVPVRFGGTLSDPTVELALTPELLARELSRSEPAMALGRRVRREVQGRIEGLLDRLRR